MKHSEIDVLLPEAVLREWKLSGISKSNVSDDTKLSDLLGVKWNSYISEQALLWLLLFHIAKGIISSLKLDYFFPPQW